MPDTVYLGLPQLVISLLREQEDYSANLTWNIHKSGKVTRLSLSCHEPDVDSKTEMDKGRPNCAKGYRRKSPSELRRDMQRKETFRKNKKQEKSAGSGMQKSAESSTENNIVNDGKVDVTAPISAPPGVTARITTRSVTRAMDRSVDSPETRRDLMDNTFFTNKCSPEQVAVTPDSVGSF